MMILIIFGYLFFGYATAALVHGAIRLIHNSQLIENRKRVPVGLTIAWAGCWPLLWFILFIIVFSIACVLVWVVTSQNIRWLFNKEESAPIYFQESPKKKKILSVYISECRDDY